MKFGAISEPEFAINQTLLKIHVSDGYHKQFCKIICYGTLRVFWSKKSILQLKFRSAQKFFQKIKFRIFLTWWTVLVISVIVPVWWYHLHIFSLSQFEIMARVPVISAFEKSDFHLMNSISKMAEALIISILELILLRSRSKK